ncbi:sensor histidine kinase [Actinophytocola gossypii]|uniref:histidine kinase n=1 Tax=Actinophytocola gossypii TaxID=2812003 RepID=A0ABT2J679_9PSEU|nr:histidine kinase [Actinophytocola gossypii]MCT2583373.1 sensor histidine kinase [Actinophytocola gossypii]
MLTFLLRDQRHLVAFDVLVALVFGGIVVFAAIDAEPPGSVREPVWVSFLAGLAIGGPIAVRRRWPLPALVVAMASAAVCLLTGVVPTVAVGAPLVAIAVVLYLVARTEPRGRSAVALAVCVVAFAVSVVTRRPAFEAWLDTGYGLAFGTAVLLTGWTLGLTARVRQAYADEAVARAAREAVARERLRIARELHDIVAHSMSLIAVKAGIGNHVAESRPAEAREALRVIEDTSRGSLAEMRHLLGVLRAEGDGAALAPAPGLAALPDLASRAADAGVSVTVEVGAGDVPEGVGLSVYRIVQEAVTNVVRHAGPTRCRVTVTPTGEDVRVEVTNDGPVLRAEPHAGHGLVGMRERVAVYGGTFAAGPRAGGGFLVTATIPFGTR